MSDTAARHRTHAAAFGDRVRGASAWDVPTPVDGWTARDIVRHLTEWLPPFLASGAGIRLEPGPSVDDDPAAAWAHQTAAVQAILDDPATATMTFTHPRLPPAPLPQALDRFYIADVFMHTWDLARATGQDDRLDPAVCAEMLAGMEPLDDVLRASGQFGPKVPVDADADVQTRLIAFIGRDPNWTPPAPAG